jgi:hypothetical protein
MHSPNKRKRTAAEDAHIALIKAMPCCVCGKAGPSECHEIEQGKWYLSLPLCSECHRHDQRGLHGAKANWKLHRKTELGCLNDTWRIIRCGTAANDDAPVRSRQARASTPRSDNELLPRIVPRRY